MKNFVFARKFVELFHNPWHCIFKVLFYTRKVWPDKFYLSLIYRSYMGEWINWKSPCKFTEKIQWLKLYNRNTAYTKMVDKASVKDYVASKIGKEFIIPTLGVWNKPEEIEWNELPMKFVLKTTHGGGGCGVAICKDKNTFDRDAAIEKIKKSLSADMFYAYREWPYKGVKKRIIAEKYMESLNETQKNDLIDYKFFCFNGEPIYCQVIRDRHLKETIDFYDVEWNHQEFVGLNPVIGNGLNPVIGNGLNPVAKPKQLKKMLEICRCLADNIPFVRIDLYEIDGKVYFGELTFFPAGGLGEFTPHHWNVKLGNLLRLPNSQIKKFKKLNL